MHREVVAALFRDGVEAGKLKEIDQHWIQGLCHVSVSIDEVLLRILLSSITSLTSSRSWQAIKTQASSWAHGSGTPVEPSMRQGPYDTPLASSSASRQLRLVRSHTIFESLGRVLAT